MALIPYTKWWESKYSPNPNTNRTWENGTWQDATFNMALALGALSTQSPLGWYDANSILIDTSKLSGTSMAASKPTQAETNSALQQGLDTAMRTIDSLANAFNTIKGNVVGAVRASTAEQGNATAAAAGNTTMMGGLNPNLVLLAGGGLLVWLLLRRK